MRKKIYLVHTGGTIGSASASDARAMSRESRAGSKRLLLSQFAESDSPYAFCADLIEDVNFPWQFTTLSESMTRETWEKLLVFLRALSLEDCCGLILLHGTDTLAYTANLLSFLFAELPVPLFLVSGNRPPSDPRSNAGANFRTAAELIFSGIAPHVYVPYRNADGEMRLYLGCTILQSADLSEDFRAADARKVFFPDQMTQAELFSECAMLSEARKGALYPATQTLTALASYVLLLQPYTGLSYAPYVSLLASGAYQGVVHGTYHSGTVSYPGLVLRTEAKRLREQAKLSRTEIDRNAFLQDADKLDAEGACMENSEYSAAYLARYCHFEQIPLYIAPSVLGEDQYETMHLLHKNTGVFLLPMSTEAAYTKLLVGIGAGMYGTELHAYMQTNICGEMIQ